MTSATWIALLVFGLPGAVFLFNPLRIDERLAAVSRTLPWWLKGVGADYPFTYRMIGLVYVILAVVLAIVIR